MLASVVTAVVAASLTAATAVHHDSAVDRSVLAAAEALLEHRGRDTAVGRPTDVASRLTEAFAFEAHKTRHALIAEKFRDVMASHFAIPAAPSHGPQAGKGGTHGHHDNGPQTIHDETDLYKTVVSHSSHTEKKNTNIESHKGGAKPLTATPQQLHLSIYDDAGSVVVMWTTSLASNKSTACVAPTKTAGGAANADDISGGREDFASAATCFQGAAYTYHPISVLPWSGRLHRVAIPRGFIVPGKEYTYKVGDPSLGSLAEAEKTPGKTSGKTSEELRDVKAQQLTEPAWSELVSFTAPDTQSRDREIFVAIGGDMGTIQLTGWQQAKQMLEFHRTIRKFDAFWLLGDIAYSTLDPPKLNFEFFWDTFMQQEAPLVQSVPMLVTYGNHDFSGGDSGAFINRFWNPRSAGSAPVPVNSTHPARLTAKQKLSIPPLTATSRAQQTKARNDDDVFSGSGEEGPFAFFDARELSGADGTRRAKPATKSGNGNFYWFYTHGPVTFISMCTERGLTPENCEYLPGSPQYQWLESTLKNVDRTKTPWVVLAGHRPMYSTDRSTDSGPLQRTIEPLIVKYGVDMQVAGHMHATELTAPIAFNKPNMSGVSQLPSWPANATTTASAASALSSSALPLNYNGAVRYLFQRPRAPVHVTLGMLGAVCDERFVDPAPRWSLYRNGTILDDAEGVGALRATPSELEVTVVRQSTREVMWQVLLRK